MECFSYNLLSMFLSCVTFVKNVTSQSVKLPG